MSHLHELSIDSSLASLTSICCDLRWRLDSSPSPAPSPAPSSAPVHDPSRARGHDRGLSPAPCPSLSPFPSLSRGRGAPSRAPALCPSLSFPSRAPVVPSLSFLFPPPVSAGAQQEKRGRMCYWIQNTNPTTIVVIHRYRQVDITWYWKMVQTPWARHAHILPWLIALERLASASEEVLLALMFPPGRVVHCLSRFNVDTAQFTTHLHKNQKIAVHS